jgi:hypothetical protein
VGANTRPIILPDLNNKCNFGPEVNAMSVYLHLYLNMPLELVGAFFYELFGRRLSDGTILNATRALAEKVQDVNAFI